MSKSAKQQIDEIRRNVERLAGTDTVREVMAGSEAITASSKQAKVAVWVQGAMERLDRLVDEETRNRIMNRCGANCAAVHQELIRRAKSRRAKAGSLETFLEEEERNPPAGTRLQRQGESWFQYYTPHDYSRPMRCFCSLMSGLPEGQTVSATFCQCSVGFVRAYWEALLDRPVEVELLHSAVTGAEECKFRISPQCLDQSLAEATEENLHDEVESDFAVGNEAW